MSRKTAVILAFFALFVHAGCAHKPPPAREFGNGCVEGVSGPTLNPGDAVRNAQIDARESMGGKMSQTFVKDLVDIRNNTADIHTFQRVSGVISDTVIVKMWTKWGGKSRAASDREVHAVACPRSAAPATTASVRLPAWILNVPRKAGEACAVGLAGPVFKGTDQEANAVEDGALALAEALELKLDIEIDDNWTALPDVLSRSRTRDELVSYCREKLQVRDRWQDKNGAGPLDLSGTLYVLVCMPV